MSNEIKWLGLGLLGLLGFNLITKISDAGENLVNKLGLSDNDEKEINELKGEFFWKYNDFLTNPNNYIDQSLTTYNELIGTTNILKNAIDSENDILRKYQNQEFLFEQFRRYKNLRMLNQVATIYEQRFNKSLIGDIKLILTNSEMLKLKQIIDSMKR